MFLFICYSFLLLFLTIFSYGFVDGNFPYETSPFLYNLVHFQRGFTTMIYIIVLTLFFLSYGWVLWLVRKKRLVVKQVWWLIGIGVIMLFFSFPAFSYDIFNYIATAKVTFFYRENPYIVMPLEIPNEPMLKFMHAANKTALYGPVWIFLTAIPHILGLGNIFLTVFTFKAFIILFYLGLAWLIWNMSNKNTWSLAFFALNPLVIVETLVSAHNDVVMMFFALLSFYLLKKKKFLFSVFCFLFSIFIKFATIFLLPIYGYLLYRNLKREKADWQKIWKWSAVLMFVIFLLSPLREELYPWYLIWPLTFMALIEKDRFLIPVSLAFSFGLMFRIVPFLYTGSWSGTTPLIKKIVTFLPPSVIFLLKKWELKD